MVFFCLVSVFASLRMKEKFKNNLHLRKKDLVLLRTRSFLQQIPRRACSAGAFLEIFSEEAFSYVYVNVTDRNIENACRIDGDYLNFGSHISIFHLKFLLSINRSAC